MNWRGGYLFKSCSWGGCQCCCCWRWMGSSTVGSPKNEWGFALRWCFWGRALIICWCWNRLWCILGNTAQLGVGMRLLKRLWSAASARWRFRIPVARRRERSVEMRWTCFLVHRCNLMRWLGWGGLAVACPRRERDGRRAGEVGSLDLRVILVALSWPCMEVQARGAWLKCDVFCLSRGRSRQEWRITPRFVWEEVNGWYVGGISYIVERWCEFGLWSLVQSKHPREEAGMCLVEERL